MAHRHIQLQFALGPAPQHSARLHNALFELLQALRAEGSIQHAARAMGASYRHVWGALRQWEAALGDSLVQWTQGQPARLAPLAERLLAGEALALARLGPGILQLQQALEAVMDDALDGPRVSLHISTPELGPLQLALRELARQHTGLAIHWRPADDSLAALRAMQQGRSQAALIRIPLLRGSDPQGLPVLRAALPTGRPRLLACARRQMGWAHRLPPEAAALAGWPALLAPAGSWLRPALESDEWRAARLGLQQAGLPTQAWDRVQAPVAQNPEEALLALLARQADGALVPADLAAAHPGLQFTPLYEEDQVLMLPGAAGGGDDAQAASAVAACLQESAWAQAVAQVPGCQLHRPGLAWTWPRPAPDGSTAD